MVGQINPALAAYQQGAQQTAQMSSETQGPSFADMVQNAAYSVRDAHVQAENVSAAALVGRADPLDVVTAVNNAEMSLRTAVNMRDKVLQAYQEILRMPI